jgi:hypothetical protein
LEEILIKRVEESDDIEATPEFWRDLHKQFADKYESRPPDHQRANSPTEE